MSAWSKISQATDEAQVAKDLLGHYVSGLKESGALPQSTGVTTPLPEITSGEQIGDVLSQLTRDYRAKKGITMESIDTPADQTYSHQRYNFVKAEEGSRSLVYDDATGKAPAPTGKTGNLTVGIGFNMDRKDARQVMSKALGFDDAQFDAVYSGQKGLDEGQIRNLFEHTINEAESVVRTKLAGVDLSTPQRLALVSMAFNNPSLIGAKITEALKSGDTEGAINEILYNSGTKKNKALAGRRYREAAMMTGGSGLPDFKQYFAGLSGTAKA